MYQDVEATKEADALCIKAAWNTEFDRSRTKNKEFHLASGSSTQVLFMTSSEKQYIATSDGFQVPQLHYKQNMSMLLHLPHKWDGLSDLVKEAVSDSSSFDIHVPYLESPVKVGKFIQVLRKMGLRTPFTTDVDFGEMVLGSHADDKLYVSSVCHGAAIPVDEAGTVASAATRLRGLWASRYQPPPVDFVADHPFMFAIGDNKTGAVLFLGHAANP